jgi:hypothetical protein
VKLQLTSPSFGYGGPTTVEVGGREFAVPPGSVVRRVRGGRLAYVLDGERVHAFAPGGELEMSPALQARARRRYFT